MERYSFFVTLAAMLVFSFGLTNGQTSIYLSGFDGGYSGADTIATGQQVVWTFALQNNTGNNVTASLNGFVVYAVPESSVTWVPIVIDSLDLSGTGAGWLERFDGIYFTYPNASFGQPPTTGMGRDTVGIAGVTLFNSGFENGFDAAVFTVTIPLPGIPDNFEGGVVCIDSTTFDHSAQNAWVWVTTAGGVVPDWSGPHCYDIVNCCIGNRGDLNGDGDDASILDMTYLVDFIFRGGIIPGCPNEADANSDGTPSHILDLTFLVDFIFRGGPPPGPCL